MSAEWDDQEFDLRELGITDLDMYAGKSTDTARAVLTNEPRDEFILFRYAMLTHKGQKVRIHDTVCDGFCKPEDWAAVRPIVEGLITLHTGLEVKT